MHIQGYDHTMHFKIQFISLDRTRAATSTYELRIWHEYSFTILLCYSDPHPFPVWAG